MASTREERLEAIRAELAPFQELTGWIADLIRDSHPAPFGQIMDVGEDSDGMIIDVVYTDGTKRTWAIDIQEVD